MTALRRYWPAAAVFVGVLAVWELAVVAFDIEGFLLPKPSVIADTFSAEWSVLWRAALFTLREAAGGFLIGAAAGALIALATSRWRIVREGVLPVAIAINSTPIVALAPIMNNWFTITSPVSKMAIVAVLVFFPVMINMVRGLREVDPSALELMRSYASGEFAVLRKIRLQNSFPYLFSALKVGASLCVIGAIVSEYFGGSREALGVYISQQAALFHFAEAWAAIIVASTMGIGLYALILLFERLVMPWHVSLRKGE